MIASTWESRDLPVLEAIVELCDEGNEDRAMLGDIVARSGLDEVAVGKALRALTREEPPYFSGVIDVDDGTVLGLVGPTGHARRTVGSWPTPELLASRLVEALDKAADEEPDEEKKGWLRKTAAWFGGAGREVAVDVTAAVINRQITGGA